MKDKQIRKILIEYLKASNSRIRIFQEKSIGSSICDVMTVTDCLTGYEIKSDADNYQRFESQCNSYDRFFDKNYIVVGESHVKSAENKVPPHWGIVCIKSNNIEIVRTARKNQAVRRRSQLSVLWKLELKNLLVINSMPLFAQKDKGYISDRIAETVDSDTLGKQIANELFNRDYSTYEAEDYTIKQDNPVVTNLPEAEIVDSLSEENLNEYTLDQWIALYHRAQIVREKKTFDYDKQLVKRTEHNIKYTDITPMLGAPWISEGIINEFIQHLYGEDEYRRAYNKPTAKREPITGSWNVSEKKSQYTSYNTNITNTFGTNRFNALQILESTLNLREIKIHDGAVFNQKETVAALEKQKVIVAEFIDNPNCNFDEWHKEVCNEFYDSFYNKALGNGYETIHFGKAQKIVNMLFKYLYCFDDNNKDAFINCHMPLDKYTLDWFFEKVCPEYNNKRIPWSNLDLGTENQIGTYLWIQNEIREYLKKQDKYPKLPLQAEFFIWAEYKQKDAEKKRSKTI